MYYSFVMLLSNHLSLSRYNVHDLTMTLRTLHFLPYNTRWFKYDRDYLCLYKSQFVPVIFEPPCILLSVSTCSWDNVFCETENVFLNTV